MRTQLVTPLVLALLATGAALTAQAASTANLQAQAKLDMQHARAIALKTYPGHIVKQELEREPGGSGLRYSFDITAANVTHEVGVDAHTGKVLENSIEGADND
ncbi:PepSY domain-containing protein [Rhodanobacter lindaniclasticus]|uniref:Peptidase M4 n=1 Tax=Rhodanobacter lindaniclasticus TaxID=75310 RepID=A0A4S3K5K7_9GAMM|nr:PepSY domain-containing protein [Rhodanobacter lindaniclasticus]THD03409.1 peptidase M4 [Rhodanobacter lindaniclasticus]